MNLNGVLSAMVEGLYRETASDNLPEAFAIAPLYASTSGRAEFLISAGDHRFDDRKVFGKAVSASAAFIEDPTQLTTQIVQLQAHNSGMKVLPETVAASLRTDIVSSLLREQADQIYGGYLSEFINVAGNDLPNAIAPLVISTPSSAVVGSILDYVEQIELASNKKPNVAWLSAKAARKFQLLDEVQETTSLAGFTVSPNNVRRTGSATMTQVRDFFRTRFDLELYVENRTIIDSTGTNAYAGEDKMILAYAAPGPQDSALKTFHLGTYGGTTLINYRVREAMAPYPEGQTMTATAVYKVEATNPNAGLFVDLTL
jgi:hypothetical protein